MSNDRVIVVGAGPVGLTAALALGRRGIPTVLLAAEPGLVMELRGSTFHPPTLDLLDEFGVVPRMIDVGLKAPTWQFRDRETGPVATFDLSMLAGDTNHPYRVQCEQWKLMRFLEEELRKLPGSDIRFGHEVTSVRPDDDAVTVAVETASGPVSLTGRYVVAADGARSAVRRSLAVDFEGFTYPELFLIASTDFRFEDKLTDIAYVNYIADPLEWLVLLRVPELWRVLVPAPENSDREKLLSDDSLQQVLQRVVARPEPYRIAHRSIYHVHQRVANCFRRRSRRCRQRSRRCSRDPRHRLRRACPSSICRASSVFPPIGISRRATRPRTEVVQRERHSISAARRRLLIIEDFSMYSHAERLSAAVRRIASSDCLRVSGSRSLMIW